MQPSKKEHMVSIQTRFIAEHADKFKKGTIEHHDTDLRTDFDLKALHAMKKEEILDLVSYVYTEEEKINELYEYIDALEKSIAELYLIMTGEEHGTH